MRDMMYPSEPDDSHRSTATRRRLLAATGAGLAVAAAGCTGGDSDAEAVGEESGDLQEQLDAVREATADYAEPEAALEDGFNASGPYVPGMGWHFIHPGRTETIAEEGFSREKPNLLTYVETDEELELSAVEYGGPVEAVDENPDLFADEDADATEGWHVHETATHVFATGDGESRDPSEIPLEEWLTRDNWSEFRPPEELEPGDTVSLNWGSTEGKEGDRTERVVDLATTHPSLNTLHAWVHVENPEGVFAPVNPEFTDGDPEH